MTDVLQIFPQELLIACPSKKNYIEITKEAETVARCVSGSTLSVGGKNVEAKELDCKSKAGSEVIKTDRKCAGGKGTVLEIGFKVSGMRQFFHPEIFSEFSRCRSSHFLGFTWH